MTVCVGVGIVSAMSELISKKEGIMNLPNKLTVLRMVLIPFMIFFYLANFIPYGIGKIVALVIFIVGALTDLADGKIARKRHLVTDFGKFLDPIADKMLTTSLLLLLIVDGTIKNPYGVIIAIIIVSREFMVSALRLIAVTKGQVLAADIWGKAKTMVQMIALPVCTIYAYMLCCGFNIWGWLVATFMWASYLSLGLATVLTVISGVNYIVRNRQCLADK